MKTTMVRYRLSSAAHAETNAALVRAVFDELRAKKPEGVRYATYRLADGLTFVHIASHTGTGSSPIPALDAFREFQRDLKSRCDELPVATDLTPVDSYG